MLRINKSVSDKYAELAKFGRLLIPKCYTHYEQDAEALLRLDASPPSHLRIIHSQSASAAFVLRANHQRWSVANRGTMAISSSFRGIGKYAGKKKTVTLRFFSYSSVPSLICDLFFIFDYFSAYSSSEFAINLQRDGSEPNLWCTSRRLGISISYSIIIEFSNSWQVAGYTRIAITLLISITFSYHSLTNKTITIFDSRNWNRYIELINCTHARFGTFILYS